MNIYLDIDGVLITKDSQSSKQDFPFEYNMWYSTQEFEKITQGYYAPEKGMDERWRFIFSGQDLYILRSWSNWVAYQVTFEQRGDLYVVKQAKTYLGITENKDSWNNYHAKAVFVLIEKYLLGLDLFFLLDNKIDEALKIDINGLHGFGHWKSVYKNGLVLADKHNCDKTVIKYFAFLHDVARISEFTDKNHGERAVEMLKDLINKEELTKKQKEQITLAIANHSKSDFCIDDNTVMACLDADRLDLPRVGITVDKKYLYFKS